MKEKPILFSGAMVRAILAGTKTQTRRIVKHVASPATADIRVVHVPRSNRFVYLDDSLGLAWIPAGGDPLQQWPRERIGEVCPYGAPGDRLWVRETWMGWKLISSERDEWEALTAEVRGKSHREHFIENGHCDSIEYRATSDSCGPWNPAIHMLREYSRITLEITDVRVERLQAISEEDARAEGVDPDAPIPSRINGTPGVVHCFGPDAGRKAFALLWDSINGKTCPWIANAWVWAVSFRRVTP